MAGLIPCLESIYNPIFSFFVTPGAPMHRKNCAKSSWQTRSCVRVSSSRSQGMQKIMRRRKAVTGDWEESRIPLSHRPIYQRDQQTLVCRALTQRAPVMMSQIGETGIDEKGVREQQVPPKSDSSPSPLRVPSRTQIR